MFADETDQPADYTTDEIKGRVKKYFKDKAPEYAARHYQIVK